MKTTLQILLFFLISIAVSAQSIVKIQINHFLDGEVYENNVALKNDLQNDFMLDRLEYYLSTFSIVHDGGQVTIIENLYVLVDLSENTTYTEIELGAFDIQNIEGVKFYFGIDKVANHADPSLWPEGHALAPKFPSMHWGWAAGYRFIALEGMSGPDINQELQFHCIGDEFYEEMSFPVTMSGADVYTIEINAEYNNLLSSIDVSNGLILHGNLGAIQTLANNLKDKVFTAAEVTSVHDSELVKTFDVYPNPTTDNLISIDIDAAGQNLSLKVFDGMGRMVVNKSANVRKIQLEESGFYYISLMDSNGNVLATRKVIVL